MCGLEFIVTDEMTNGVVTIGNFDGVHRGHQSMLSIVARIARQHARPSVVVTFDPHPIAVLRPKSALPRLTTIERRTELLQQYGADHVVVLPVNAALLNMEPQAFFQKVVLQRLQAAALVEGPDFHFGRNRTGNTGLLATLCSAAGLELTVIDAVCLNDVAHGVSAAEGQSPVDQVPADQIVSSTRIRQLLEHGHVGRAVRLLGHPHRISGTVTAGAGRGRTLGFPTANLEKIEVLLPQPGVYGGLAWLHGTSYRTAVSIGPNPTFSDLGHKVECHLIDFDGDLYGKTLAVDLLTELRPLQTFPDQSSLMAQIASDLELCRQLPL